MFIGLFFRESQAAIYPKTKQQATFKSRSGRRCIYWGLLDCKPKRQCFGTRRVQPEYAKTNELPDVQASLRHVRSYIGGVQCHGYS